MPGPVVVHLDDRERAAVRDPHRHRRAGRRVHQRVADQVADDLAQPVLVAVDGHALGDLGGDDAVGRDGARVGRGVDPEHPEVDGVARERPALVEARQEQQVVDQRRHAHRLRLGAPHRLVELGRFGEAAVAVELGVAADGRDRRAQLVRRVGDEATQPRLARGALGERALDGREHGVERVAELTRLGALGFGRHPLARGHRRRSRPRSSSCA